MSSAIVSTLSVLLPFLPASCRLEGERKLASVLRKTEMTPGGFITQCINAQDTYKEQTLLAHEAVSHLEEGCFKWSHRPNVMTLIHLLKGPMQGLPLWTEERIVEKMLPLLIEWDVRQGPRPMPSAGQE